MDDSLRVMQWQHHSNIFFHNNTLCPMGSDCMEELDAQKNAEECDHLLILTHFLET